MTPLVERPLSELPRAVEADALMRLLVLVENVGMVGQAQPFGTWPHRSERATFSHSAPPEVERAIRHEPGGDT